MGSGFCETGRAGRKTEGACGDGSDRREPDVIAFEKKTGEFVFCDCSAETPAARRGLCYDKKGLDSRKENKPAGSAVETAAALGAEMLDEDQYRALQDLGEFDLKPRAGYGRLTRSARWAAPFFATAGIITCSPTTTAPTLIIPQGDFAFG